LATSDLFHLVNVCEFIDRWQVMEERAHAKINLSLRVLYRREDGFHEIETLIAPITLHDCLRFEAADQFQFRCSDPTLPVDADNLVTRAARAFFEETKIPSSVRITLEKRIPHGAGLGGGSSDAGATLRGLNKLFSANLASEKLKKLATTIGSDVPFFLHSGAAICRGLGEIVEPVSIPAALALVLFKPTFGVATAWAYSRWRDSRELPSANYAAQHFDKQTFVNDLERPVFAKFPFLPIMKTWLLRQTEVAVALMSGSGSTLFAVVNSNDNGEGLANRARAELDEKLWTFPARTV
jgi:4-diphosphocytidyl-2-C-methyl-D-erythritol kinase